MAQEEEIVNRVKNSSLVTFDLEKLYQPGERVLFDIKDQLYEGLILREKDFRDFVKNNDWSQYKGKFLAITCTADAIVPTWAFMLISIALEPYAKAIHFGSLEQLEERLFLFQLATINWDEYKDAKVVVKGCSKVAVPVSTYVEVVSKLRPLVSSLMFGEPCSTVPLYKAKSKA